MTTYYSDKETNNNRTHTKKKRKAVAQDFYGKINKQKQNKLKREMM